MIRTDPAAANDAGLLLTFKRGTRTYIPASERQAYPARLADAQRRKGEAA